MYLLSARFFSARFSEQSMMQVRSRAYPNQKQAQLSPGVTVNGLQQHRGRLKEVTVFDPHVSFVTTNRMVETSRSTDEIPPRDERDQPDYSFQSSISPALLY